MYVLESVVSDGLILQGTAASHPAWACDFRSIQETAIYFTWNTSQTIINGGCTLNDMEHPVSFQNKHPMQTPD